MVLDEALGLLESVPDDDTPFFDHVTFGLCPLPEGPGGEVRLYFEETIFLFHRFRRAQAAAYALNNVAWTARAVGDADVGRAVLADALARFRAIEDASGEALTLNHMGNLARSRGRHRGRPRASGRRARAAPHPGREARRHDQHHVPGHARDRRRASSNAAVS